MGLFFTWLYIGHAVLPPVAGWLQDVSGSAAMPFYFASGLALSIVPLFAAFRSLQPHLLHAASSNGEGAEARLVESRPRSSLLVRLLSWRYCDAQEAGVNWVAV
jgi:hypothetical protein